MPSMPAVSMHDSRRATQVTLRMVVLLSSALTLVFLFLSFSDRGIGELQQAKARVGTLRAEIEQAEADNTRLRAEIESVKTSSFAVEQIAREDLGMSKKGEVVYMLPKK